MNFDLDFYKGKKVFVTGHTGFKGSWLCKMLVNAGAIVTGYSLNPPTSPSLYEIAGIEQDVHSVIGDIRDFKTLKAAFDEAQPEIVLHLAAQPIVRDSYKNPAYTYETNVMGSDDFWDDASALEHIHINLTETDADVLVFTAKRYYESEDKYTYIITSDVDRTKITVWLQV